MATPQLLNFDIQIEPSAEGYRVQVLDCPAGEAEAAFRLPFSDLEIENLLLRLAQPRRTGRRHLQGMQQPETDAARTFGERLFAAVFADEIRGLLRSSLNAAQQQSTGLRLRLRLANTPELANLPWEYLFDPTLKRYFCLSAETPIVRFLELSEPIRSLSVSPPLRILVMIASPSDMATLDVEREWANLRDSLSDLERQGLIMIDRLETASLPALQHQLRRESYHIFHFIGHGGFDAGTGDGVLLLEDEQGRGRRTNAEHLGTFLHGHRSLRLAVLNACQGARGAGDDPFAGTAQSLIRQGIPAVIAMQFEISDAAAITFAQEFYGALADAYPVDMALAEARKAIYGAGMGVEWGTPVLYMHSPDGRLFDVTITAKPVGDETPVIAPSVPTPPAPAAPPASPAVAPKVEPPPAPAGVLHNLPQQLTSFVGRAAEVAEVTRLLTVHRFVTLLGPGGCGKTRLALAIAEGLVERSEPAAADGVWWVDLAAATDGDQAVQAAAAAVGVREEPGQPLATTLAGHLETRSLLLILDNCETLADVAADLGERLLRACPRVRMLATSRETLGVPGEQTWPVPTLSLPPAERLNAMRALESEAVQLLVARAALVDPDFSVTDANAADVARICRQLDGIPLAIELAAARLKVLSPAQVAERMADLFRLLKADGRAVVLVIESSYATLSEPEKTLFNRLSVFAGGFDLDAAEAVGAAATSDPIDVIDVLTELVDRSMVSMVPAGESRRYRLLETLRHYGRDRLVESGDAPRVQRAHAEHFVRLAERVEEELRGSNQANILQLLEREHDNFQAVFQWAQSVEGPGGPGASELALRLGGSLAHFWELQGRLSEGRQVLTSALAHSGAAKTTATRAKALAGAGTLAKLQADYAAAAAQYEEAVAIWRELGDHGEVGRLTIDLGSLANLRGDATKAHELGEKALALGKKLGDQWMTARAANLLGNVANYRSDYDGARRYYGEALRLFRAMDNQWAVSVALNNLGQVELDSGNVREARRLLEESVALARKLEDPLGVAHALNNLGDVAIQEGDYAAARQLQAESLTLRRELGDRQGIATSLESFATLARLEGDPGQAAQLLAAAGVLREAIAAPRPAHEHAEEQAELAALRQALGEPAFAAAWEDGRALGAADAVAEALGEGP